MLSHMTRFSSVVSALLVVAVAVAPIHRVVAEDMPPGMDTPKQVEALFEQGKQNYTAGRYAAAAADFANALRLKPEDRQIYDLYKVTGDRFFDLMRQQDVLRDVLDDLLRRARWHQARVRRDPIYHDVLIGRLVAKAENERVVIFHGNFDSVPRF